MAKLWSEGQTRKLHHLPGLQWKGPAHAAHCIGYTGVCLLVISGDEGDFRGICHMWNNLLSQLAQNLYCKLLAARGESDKEEVIIPLWCQELSPNQEKLGCHRVCHYHQNEAWQRFRAE